jgi:nitroimidazol reductase NimA-like FMN-containing flavoprotein (pyridoxamine 5'-phosphate oxidase superfamily)
VLGELNTEQIEAVLHPEVIARIGCISDGRVYVVPVSYVYDGTYIWGHGMDEAKLLAMREHPEVCVEVEQVADAAAEISSASTGPESVRTQARIGLPDYVDTQDRSFRGGQR